MNGPWADGLRTIQRALLPLQTPPPPSSSLLLPASLSSSLLPFLPLHSPQLLRAHKVTHTHHLLKSATGCPANAVGYAATGTGAVPTGVGHLPTAVAVCKKYEESLQVFKTPKQSPSDFPGALWQPMRCSPTTDAHCGM